MGHPGPVAPSQTDSRFVRPAPDPQLDTYDLIFNHQRPLQAHGGKTPAERYGEVDEAIATH